MRVSLLPPTWYPAYHTDRSWNGPSGSELLDTAVPYPVVPISSVGDDSGNTVIVACGTPARLNTYVDVASASIGTGRPEGVVSAVFSTEKGAAFASMPTGVPPVTFAMFNTEKAVAPASCAAGWPGATPAAFRTEKTRPLASIRMGWPPPAPARFKTEKAGESASCAAGWPGATPALFRTENEGASASCVAG